MSDPRDSDFLLGILMSCRNHAYKINMPENANLLVVDATHQALYLLTPEDQMYTFPASTSLLGLGELVDSRKTPRGFHEIVERYGDGMQPGSVFVSRSYTGQIVSPDQWQQSNADMILTRILRLTGRVPGFNANGNVDSYERMIYLHGTNQEQYIGREPSSQGCIRLRNLDVIALFDLIKDRSTWCWIGDLNDADLK